MLTPDNDFNGSCLYNIAADGRAKLYKGFHNFQYTHNVELVIQIRKLVSV